MASGPQRWGEAVFTGNELAVTPHGNGEVYHPAGLRSDQDLVSEVLAGNAEAFAGLVRRYRQTYARFAIRMLGDRDDAEDALQSAFLRAFRGLAQCAEPDRFGAWLYRIVVNECRTAATRRGRRVQVLVRNPMALAAAVEEQDYSWSLAVRQEIQHALNQLPSDQRGALLLKHVEERQPDEFASFIQREGDQRRIAGFSPIYTLLRLIDAEKGQVLRYDRGITDQYNSTVTYASMAFF